MAYIEFTQWLPDYDSTNEGQIVSLENVIPTTKGHKGAPSPSNVGVAALAAECRGIAHVQKLDGTYSLFAGTTEKIYQKSEATWTDVTRVSSDYSLATGRKWRFTQQGNITLAVSRDEYGQKFNHTTPDTDFSDLTAMPIAAQVEAVGQFILIGDYINPVGSVDTPDGWACSAIGDYTDWTASVDNQCVYGRLLDTPGKITGLKRLADYAVYYKEKSMYLARYVGSPDAWVFSLISDTIGAVNNESIVRVGTTHYFLSYNGFFSYNSAQLVPIGNQIKEWFKAHANTEFLYKAVAVHAENLDIVFWYWPYSGSETLLAWVAYNYKVDKWGYGTLSSAVEAAVEYITEDPGYDDLLAMFATYDLITALGTTYDNLAPPADTPYAAIVNSSHQMQTLTGEAGVGIILTNHYGSETSVNLVRKIRPRFFRRPDDGSLVSLFYETFNNLNDVSSSANGFADLSNNNSWDFLASARWHRGQMFIQGDFEIAGLDVDIRPAGKE